MALLVDGKPVGNWILPQPSPGSLRAVLVVGGSGARSYVAGQVPVTQWRIVNKNTISNIVFMLDSTIMQEINITITLD